MRVLICVAWPYASGPRHLGHAAGCYLPADVAARYHRLAGDEVLMVSGSDEHGTPITVAADRAGLTPAELAGREHERIARSFERLGVSFDVYTRTTTTNHERVVHDVFARLRERGLIDERLQESAWCPAEQRSIPDRYATGRCPRCDDRAARGDQCDACGAPLDPQDLLEPVCGRCGEHAEVRPLRQLFLRLDLLQTAVDRFIAGTADRWRRATAAQTRALIGTGLQPRAITRDLQWGIRVPIPGWDDRRLYVWFEDVIGYLSATVEAEPDSWQRWWTGEDLLHRYFIGKDNTFFHTIWWPALLLGGTEGLHLPDEVVVNHYLTRGASKLSASRGGHESEEFTLDEALDRAGVDPLRHALCAMAPESSDVEFTWAACEELTRSGLLGEIANPAHRVTTQIWQRFGGRVDESAWRRAPTRGAAESLLEATAAHYRRGDLREALASVHAIGREVNRQLARDEPWKQDDDGALEQLSRIVHLVDGLAVAAWPIVPGTASRIRAALGRPPAPAGFTPEAEPPRIDGPPDRPLASP